MRLSIRRIRKEIQALQAKLEALAARPHSKQTKVLASDVHNKEEVRANLG